MSLANFFKVVTCIYLCVYRNIYFIFCKNDIGKNKIPPRLPPVGPRLIRGWSAIVPFPGTFILINTHIYIYMMILNILIWFIDVRLVYFKVNVCRYIICHKWILWGLQLFFAVILWILSCQRRKTPFMSFPIPSMYGICSYITWMVGFYGINVGKYTSPMDPSWEIWCLV